LDAILEAGIGKVTRVDSTPLHPDSSTGKAWWKKFKQRFKDKLNKKLEKFRLIKD